MITAIISCLLFAYALFLVLSQLRIFQSTGINLVLSIAISGASFFFLFLFSSIIGSASLFFICAEKIKGAKGMFLGLFLGIGYFLLGLIL